MTVTKLHQEIANITNQLVDRYNAEKVILFGSASRDAQRAHDTDFLIVKDHVPRDALARAREVRLLVKKRVAADFLVLTQQELQERVRLEDPFITTILREGKVLYG